MNGSEQEVVGAHHLCQLHSFRKILACLIKKFVDVLVYFRRIGTCRLKHHTRHTRMAVHTAVVSVAVLSQLYVGNIFQFQHLASIARTDDDVAKFFGSNQTSLILHRILVRFIRVLAKRTGCRFDILLGKHAGDVGRNQFVLCHHIRLHPYTHTIFTTHNHHITHTGDTENLWFQVDTDIVGQEVLVITLVRTGQGEHLQDTRLPLGSGHTDLGYFRRKLSRSTRHTVLHVDSRHIRISALLKIDGDAHRTGIGGGRCHVGHVLHPIDRLFQRRDYTLLQRFRTGAIIGGTHHNGRRSNIGILLNGQAEQPDDTHYDNRDRDDCR